jgi:hypothetical protein
LLRHGVGADRYTDGDDPSFCPPADVPRWQRTYLCSGRRLQRRWQTRPCHRRQCEASDRHGDGAAEHNAGRSVRPAPGGMGRWPGAARRLCPALSAARRPRHRTRPGRSLVVRRRWRRLWSAARCRRRWTR